MKQNIADYHSKLKIIIYYLALSFPNGRGSRVAGSKSRVAGFKKVAGFEKVACF